MVCASSSRYSQCLEQAESIPGSLDKKKNRRKEKVSLIEIPQKALVVSLSTIIQTLFSTVHPHRPASDFSSSKKFISPLRDSRATLQGWPQPLIQTRLEFMWIFTSTSASEHSSGLPLLPKWATSIMAQASSWQSENKDLLIYDKLLHASLPAGLPRRGDGH